MVDKGAILGEAAYIGIVPTEDMYVARCVLESSSMAKGVINVHLARYRLHTRSVNDIIVMNIS